ncbi:hypothetical protein [Hymenobacter sp. APR13]|uniref:hypothetical protein n=1 Tax=Hymenobacter sp. APR13 TaxID=1356852 RepID=UPI0004E051FB|nr:hypothetical protein [Hymenobacter sp. APR13]AII53246.1 hypothetical protein N008_14830 [Hymenobacter sp. APR13]
MQFFSYLGYLGFALTLILPALATVYIARMYGRSWRLWLLLSVLLPFVSVLLIIVVVSRESLRQEREEDARVAAEKAARRRPGAGTPDAQ